MSTSIIAPGCGTITGQTRDNRGPRRRDPTSPRSPPRPPAEATPGAEVQHRLHLPFPIRQISQLHLVITATHMPHISTYPRHRVPPHHQWVIHPLPRTTERVSHKPRHSQPRTTVIAPRHPQPRHTTHRPPHRHRHQPRIQHHQPDPGSGRPTTPAHRRRPWAPKSSHRWSSRSDRTDSAAARTAPTAPPTEPGTALSPPAANAFADPNTAGSNDANTDGVKNLLHPVLDNPALQHTPTQPHRLADTPTPPHPHRHQ